MRHFATKHKCFYSFPSEVVTLSDRLVFSCLTTVKHHKACKLQSLHMESLFRLNLGVFPW